MATEVDLQRLVVQLEASFVKYDRQWQKAMGVTDANVKKTQAKFDGLEKAIGGAGGRAARGLVPVQLQTANIAAQFQDIAVQLQSGASPFTIALQQGTQLSAALGGGGLRGALKGLAAGLGAMLSPLSLTTIAVIALGGAAVRYFTTLLQDGRISAEELKKQEDLIRRVADRWGEAAPALKAYADQIDRANELSERQEATTAAVEGTWRPIREEMEAVGRAVTTTVAELNQMGGQEKPAQELLAAFTNLERKVREQNATGEDARAVFNALNAVLPLLDESMISTAARAQSLATAIDQATNATRRLNVESRSVADLDDGDRARDRLAAINRFAGEQERINSLTTEQLALEAEVARVKADFERDNEGALLTEGQALQIAQQRLDAEERRAKLKADTKAGGKSADEAEREREAVLELIAALEFEYDQLGLTAQQQAVANELRRAGAAATDEQRERIAQLVTATMDEEASIEALTDLIQELGDIGKSAVQGIVQALADGKVEAGELQDILGNVLNMAGNLFLNQAFSGLGGGGGNLFGSLFGKRALGGPVTAGQPYLVGERGPEVIVPSRGGYVVPNHRLGDAGGGMTINIDARGAQVGVAEQIEAKFRQWERFRAPPLIRHHANTTMPENG